MRKALHVRTFCCEGVMDWVHGGGHYIDRIYVPEERLMITLVGESASAVEGELKEFTSSSPGGRNELGPQVVKEIEILDEIVTAAHSLLAAQKTYKNIVASSWKTLLA